MTQRHVTHRCALIHDEIAALDHLANCASNYATRRLIEAMKNAGDAAQVISEDVQQRLDDLAIAAVSFTMQVAVCRDFGDVAALRALEKKILAHLRPEAPA